MELQTNQVRENYESTHNKKERYGPSYSKNESSKNRPDWVTGHMYVSAPTPEQESKNNSCNDFRHSVKNPTKVLFPGGNAGNDSTFMQVDPVSAGRFCLPPTSLENNVFNNSNYVSNNQRLANAPLKERYAQPESRSIQQRAKISPIITKPSHDMEWITNSFVSSPPIVCNISTLSFIDLVFNYDELVEKGYNNVFLDQSLHSMLVFPFFLFLMTGIASILTMNTLKKSDNYHEQYGC